MPWKSVNPNNDCKIYCFDMMVPVTWTRNYCDSDKDIERNRNMIFLFSNLTFLHTIPRKKNQQTINRNYIQITISLNIIDNLLKYYDISIQNASKNIFQRRVVELCYYKSNTIISCNVFMCHVMELIKRNNVLGIRNGILNQLCDSERVSSVRGYGILNVMPMVSCWLSCSR